MSFLSAVGKDFKAVFEWLGSSKGQTTIATVEGAAAAITTAVNPGAGAALTAFEALFNVGLKSIVNAEALAAAAGEQSGTGAQKAVAAATAVTPQVQGVLVSLGVPSPTAAQVASITRVVTDSLVNIVAAFPEPVVAAPVA